MKIKNKYIYVEMLPKIKINNYYVNIYLSFIFYLNRHIFSPLGQLLLFFKKLSLLILPIIIGPRPPLFTIIIHWVICLPFYFIQTGKSFICIKKRFLTMMAPVDAQSRTCNLYPSINLSKFQKFLWIYFTQK